MRRKLYKSRRGQISTEIMYAVGVMIMIFLLLTGVSFNRRGELRDMDDYLQKRNECLKISNAIASLTSSGFNSRIVLTLRNRASVHGNGRIVIDPSHFQGAYSSTRETPCTYVGYLDPAQLGAQSTIYLDGGGRSYCFYNLQEKI